MGKTYRLKKDLPTFKAGEIFDISPVGNLVKRSECFSDCIVAYSAQTLAKFPNILKDWFEEIPEEPKTVWDLEKYDKYYYILRLSAAVAKDTWVDTSIDRNLREIGDAFLTRAEAEKEIARRRAKQILLRDTKGFKPAWGSRASSYEVRINGFNNSLSVGCCWGIYSHSDLWFATEEDAEASIKAHEKEWKIYLGVEEDS